MVGSGTRLARWDPIRLINQCCYTIRNRGVYTRRCYMYIAPWTKVNRPVPCNAKSLSLLRLYRKSKHALSLNQYWQIVWSQIVKTCSLSIGAVMIQLPEMDKEDAVRLQTYWVYMHMLFLPNSNTNSQITWTKLTNRRNKAFHQHQQWTVLGDVVSNGQICQLYRTETLVSPASYCNQ